MAKLATLMAVLLLAAGCGAVDLQQFMTDPAYLPFLQRAMQTGVCLGDPAVTSGVFDLDKCPSLLGMLAAVNGGATDYDITCEPACVETVYSLTPDCLTELTTVFNQGTETVDLLGSEFLAICEEKHSGDMASPMLSPTIAPAPAP